MLAWIANMVDILWAQRILSMVMAGSYTFISIASLVETIALVTCQSHYGIDSIAHHINQTTSLFWLLCLVKFLTL